ncbi:hypothetical protein NE237_016994 [Protea cynaroides]|uniref:DUF4283 domain-containing protein n=1 Tax=Protea cynaroides TaxID=273540 RepID=A0A9Q0QMB7_9MAGN|nr:hypothetical protein NE237_016994 [Protea cynaroides]
MLQDTPPSLGIIKEQSAIEDQYCMHAGITDEPFILKEDPFDYPEENPETTMVRRIIGSKTFRRQAISEALPSAWNTIHGFEVKPIDKSTHIFRFNYILYFFNVLKESPWLVAGNLIILQRWTKDQSWNFSSFQIWAQIHGLPKEDMQPNVAQRLVYKVGIPSQLMVIEGVIQGQKTSYLRARVSMEISKPL